MSEKHKSVTYYILHSYFKLKAFSPKLFRDLQTGNLKKKNCGKVIEGICKHLD
jgi:hypothetical protein